MLTVVTEVFGVKGELGNLALEPKLVKEQFDEKGEASVELIFAGSKLKVKYVNAQKKDFGEYEITKVSLDGKDIELADNKAVIEREVIEKLSDESHEILVTLD